MRIRFVIFLVFTILISACCYSFFPVRAQDDGLTFVRQGDEKIGREKFLIHSCFHCHRVHMDPDLPSPIPGFESATLGTVESNQNPQQLVDSLLNFRDGEPSENLEESKRDKVLEMKKDLNEASDQDLIDIVTYLRALK